MPSALKSSNQGHTLVLALSNPEFKNAMDPEIYAAGIEALSTAENNPDIRSVVITGEGAMFCAGGNLQRLQASRRESPEAQAQNIDGLHNWIETIRTYPKPVIAAVEGAAAGAGFALALSCDFIVAADNAVFAMSYRHGGTFARRWQQLDSGAGLAKGTCLRTSNVWRAHKCSTALRSWPGELRIAHW